MKYAKKRVHEDYLRRNYHEKNQILLKTHLKDSSPKTIENGLEKNANNDKTCYDAIDPNYGIMINKKGSDVRIINLSNQDRAQNPTIVKTMDLDNHPFDKNDSQSRKSDDVEKLKNFRKRSIPKPDNNMCSKSARIENNAKDKTSKDDAHVKNKSDTSQPEIQNIREHKIKVEKDDLSDFVKSISMEIKTEIDDNDLQAGLSVLEEMDESFFNQGSFPM